MSEKLYRPVKTLPPEVARKIAAGEVIDRPCAIVRELMDNAVDSGADSIQVEINGGGIDKIRIVDNGSGMTKDDLRSCAKPHATSKIRVEEDLLSLSTLGFRGEALASIAAVSKLQITSARDGQAWKLEASVTQDHTIAPANLAQGTVVQSESLFNDFPARRIFLKRPAAETTLCKQTFIEKALPRTDISFRLLVDGKQRLDLPKGQSLSSRFVEALELSESSSLFYELHGSSDFDSGNTNKPDWKFTIIIGEPSVYRNDKKLIYIYVNGRRINEYSLMQAIDYGAQGFFPNGTHPVAVLFVEMNPAHVDFNIHPAKKEARFKDLATLHHAVSSTTRDFFRNHTVSNLASQISTSTLSDSGFSASSASSNAGSKSDSYFDDEDFAPKKVSYSSASSYGTDLRKRFFSDSYSEKSYDNSYVAFKEPAYSYEAKIDDTNTVTENFRYIGNVLGVFLLAEKDNSLYLIDQHAAHERILYNKFISSAGIKQPLLVPYVIETSCEADDEYLRSIQDNLEKAGFEAKDCGEGKWEFSSVPAQWKGNEQDLLQDLLTNRISPEEVLSSLAATNACRAAIKDGHLIDNQTAKNLVAQALELEDPHCPHGRPIWKQFSKEELFQFVRRT